jgi:diketogulonate reductase-like aldo/keto reductase
MNDGNAIPLLGFGVFQLAEGDVCERSVLDALEAGYRHIDTAMVYKNEASVGRAIEKSGLPRKEIFLTTKSPFDHKAESVRNGFQQSLDKLRTDYVDLYLIHWPLSDNLAEAWGVFEELKAKGRCRSIGVSNFTVARFEKAFFPVTKTVPAVNQIELHIFNQRPELVDYCRQKGMILEAYSPLGRGACVEHPALKDIAAAHGKSPAQILIRWCVQSGFVALPKSQNKDRIIENANVFDFELSDNEMRRVKAMDEALETQNWHPQGFY